MHKERITLAIVLAATSWVLFFLFLVGLEKGTIRPHGADGQAAGKMGPFMPPAAPSIVKAHYDGTARVTAESPGIFAYAHGTASADGKFFIGMADRSGNPFPSNQIIVMDDPENLSDYAIVSLPRAGDVETMAYDQRTDKVYFLLTGTSTLDLYALDPHAYGLSLIVSTTSIDAGPRPAIATDGLYVYGITDTDPSTVFKVDLSDGSLTTSSHGHIPHGHSVAIGIYPDSTELYFGGGMRNGFEKADAATLKPIAIADLAPCSLSDDSAFAPVDDRGGYVYVGCETVPEGRRIRTEDLSVTKFSLPGGSLGMFIFGNDLYNVAQDGAIDVFAGADIARIRRYRIADGIAPLDTKGQDLEPNELFYSPMTGGIYFTAWWGVPGIYRISLADAAGLSIR